MRRILFWIHLIVGVTAAAIVMSMSVTGVLLMYEKQTIAWSDSSFRSASPTGPISIEKILAVEPKAASVTISSDPGGAASVSLGRAGTAFFDTHTGEKLGMASTEVRGFLGAVKEWHRWIALQGESRATGRAITGAANLGFLFLVVSGSYLWLPQVFSPKHFRAVLWFRGRLTGKARDFNWHNVIGIWCVVPLFLVVISGVVISYGWASNLVLQMAGGVSAQPATPAKEETSEQPFERIDAALTTAMHRDPEWRTIALRTPVSSRSPLVFTIDSGTGGQPQRRGTLTYDRQSAKTVKWESFETLEKGRQWRNWMRFVHTGEYYGLAGQTIAGLASLGGAFLVWTGVSLKLRRFSAWRKRRAA